MNRIQSAGVLRVGIRADQPGMGLRNPDTGQIDGFDREVAQLVAQAFFGARDPQEAFHRIVFEQFAADGADRLILDGTADIVLTEYTDGLKGLQLLDFAGPYYIASDGIAVRTDASSLRNVGDLVGRQACAADDFGPRKAHSGLERSEIVIDTSSGCAEALKTGRVTAMSTNLAVMMRLLDENPGEFRLLPDGRREQSYVIGFKKGDAPFRTFLNDRLEEVFQNGEWAAAFDRTLGVIGLPRPQPPTIDRHDAGTTSNTVTMTGRNTSTTRR